MKAITLHQPWASALAHGLKKYETRSWPVPEKFVGHRVAIHAAVTEGSLYDAIEECYIKFGDQPFWKVFDNFNIPALRPHYFGGVLATGLILNVFEILHVDETYNPSKGIVVELRDCLSGLRDIGMISHLEFSLGDWSVGRYAWKFQDVKPFHFRKTIPCRGNQRFWTLPTDVFEKVKNQLGEEYGW